MTFSAPKSHWPKTREQVEQLNDQLASEHPIDEYYTRSPWIIRRLQKQRLEVISRMVGMSANLRILEVGSGGGQVLQQFKDAKLTAVDVSQIYLDTARKNLAGYDVSFIKGQIEDLALPAASFDRVICTEVLEHTTAPERILSEIRRLLSPKGRAVITVPIDPVIDTAKRLLRFSPVGLLLRDRIQWGGDKYHLHKWWPWEFQRILTREFVVDERSLVPTPLLPVHACFACRPKA
jgi:2-polyprenyl-3-methyl-5-hydroxy-6-metoxy-1,4-benzoquinol methylase